MSDTVTTQSAQQFLQDNFAPWVMDLHPQVTEIGAQSATLEIPITDRIARTGGIVSGQTLAALADTAMVIACSAAQGALIPVGTVTLETQFLRPGTGTHLTAQAEVTRMGRSMVFTRCTLTAHPSGKPVALSTATFAK